MKKLAVPILVVALAAACGGTRSTQVVKRYNTIESASDAVKFALAADRITPDQAQVLHSILTVAVKHNDRAKAAITAARGADRPLSDAEKATVDGAKGLVRDAIQEALTQLAAYEARKANQ